MTTIGVYPDAATFRQQWGGQSRTGRPMTAVTMHRRPTFVGDPARGRTRAEIWAATSSDGRWTYERVEETSTPWVATFTPTGQTEGFSSLTAARRWTADPDALRIMRRDAEAVIRAEGRTDATCVRWVGNQLTRVTEDPQGCARRVADALRRIAVLDEHLAAVA